MQFSLQTLMLAFVVVAAAVGLFGLWGMALSGVVLACAAYVRLAKDSEKAFYNVVVACIFLLPCACIIWLIVLENDRSPRTYPGPWREPISVFESPVWKAGLSLAIFIVTTVLIVRRPLPIVDEENAEKEEEIRFEDTSEPEEKVEEKEMLVGEIHSPQPSPPAPLPKGEESE